MTEQHNPDGWTFATIVRWVTDLRSDDQRAVAAALQAAKEAVAAALAAAKEAVMKAEAAAGARFEDANHIKEAMLNAQKSFATLEKVEGLAAQIADIKNQLSASSGKSLGVSGSFANLNTILILVLAVAGAAVTFWRG